MNRERHSSEKCADRRGCKGRCRYEQEGPHAKSIHHFQGAFSSMLEMITIDNAKVNKTSMAKIAKALTGVQHRCSDSRRDR